MGVLIALAMLAGMLAFAAPAQATSCPPDGATWSSSAQFGYSPWGNYHVNNDEWGKGYGSQAIWISSASFGVCNIQQPVTNPDNVKSYPNAARDYPGNAWSSYTMIRGTFDMTHSAVPNSGERFQLLWDVWLNGTASSPNPIEVGMVPYLHTGWKPYGTPLGTAVFSNRSYNVVDATTGHQFYVFVAVNNFKAGTVPIRKALGWLYRHGKISKSDTLNSIGGGWEIFNSGTTPLTLQMDNYSQTVS